MLYPASAFKPYCWGWKFTWAGRQLVMWIDVRGPGAW